MEKLLLNIQLFADGAGTGAGEGNGAENGGTGNAAVNTEVAAPKKGRKGNELANVVYGKQTAQTSDDYSAENGLLNTREVNTKTQEEKAVAFENMIKGEYREDFNNRVEKIVRNRLGDTKAMQQQAEAMKPIIDMLSSKYGVDAANLDGLAKAIQEDDAFYQDAAAKRGMSVEQFREVKKLEDAAQHWKEAYEAQEMQRKGQETYNRWISEAQDLQEKYDLTGFDFEQEVMNPDFVGILKSGGSVEAAYKAVHFDELLGGAMAGTAHKVKEQLAKNVAMRNARPAEGAVSAQPGVIMKPDVNKLTKQDRAEIARRVSRGEIITF